ncbi:hypothetical protein [Hyphomicrobium sp. DY-1]|uniref:hypothetical protein n=1 Tax=Hyphomicrobium sp. DY-1 TaxID=3075650 RepID=UPI0039C0EDF9
MSGFVDATPQNGDGDLSGGESRGFAESFSDAYNATYKAASQLGLDAEYDRVSGDQERRVFERTGKYLPELPLESFAGNSGTNIARFYSDGGTQEQADALTKYDGEIDKVRKEHPDLNLKNSREMWDQIRDEARAAEEKDAQPRSFGGAVGGFLGGAAAQFNPIVNPVNAVTAGLGGVGKTIVGRVASEAGLQGGIQAVDELTGVAETRRLLGLEDGLSGSLGRIASAAGGGALLRGATEALGAGFRRLLGSPADDVPSAPGTPEAPTPDAAAQTADALGTNGALFKDYADFEAQLSASVKEDAQRLNGIVSDAAPFGRSRLATARHASDLDNIERQLNDFNHDGPWTLNNTAAHFEDPVNSEIVLPHWARPAEEAIPMLARQVDPELYAQIDKLDAMVAEERAKLGETQKARSALPIADVDAALAKADDLEVKIADQQARLATMTNPKARKLAQKTIADLERQQREIIKGLGPHADTVIDVEARASSASNKLLELEHDRRALIPLQKRAEDIAVERYLTERPARENFNAMVKLLRSDLRLPERQEIPELSQTRRPSEKATKAEGGGDDTPPGKPQRPATTSGPKGKETAGEAKDQADEFLQDLTRQNATNDKEVQGAFDAVRAVREAETPPKEGEQPPKPITEIYLGDRRYGLDDEIPVDVIRNEAGEVTGTKTMTVRQILEEMGDDADMLAAMRSCSL